MNKKAFFALSTVVFTSMLGMSILSPLMAIYATTMGANGFWLGVMFSGFSLSGAIFSPVAGWLADHQSRKMLMVVGLVAYALVSIGYALANNIYLLTVVRLFHGIASAVVVPVAQAYIGDITPKGKEGTYMNIFMMFMYLGMAIGPFMGGTLSDLYGMNTAFYSMAALAALSLVFLFIAVPDLRAKAVKKRAGLKSMIDALRDNRMKASNLHLCSRAILRQGIISFLPLYAAKMLGMSTSMIGIIISVYVFVEAISQGAMGPVTDRGNKGLLLVGGTLAAAILSFFLGNMSTELTLLALLIPIAITTSLARSAASAYSVDYGHKTNEMGAAMGIFNSTQYLGSAIGPIMFGIVTDSFGLQSIFPAGAITGLIVVPFMIFYLLARQPEPPLVAEAVEETKIEK
jgi:MFS transporter, DHA1 family, multidrug resistance protein